MSNPDITIAILSREYHQVGGYLVRKDACVQNISPLISVTDVLAIAARELKELKNEPSHRN